MFTEINNQDLMDVDGGMGLLAIIVIGTLCLGGGTILGLATTYVTSKF